MNTTIAQFLVFTKAFYDSDRLLSNPYTELTIITDAITTKNNKTSKICKTMGISPFRHPHL